LYKKTVLDNGLRILTESMPHTHSASICIFLGVGSRYEPPAKAGISHFVEHVLFRGTPRRPTSCDVSTAIEGIGGVLNGGTDRETTVYWCKVPQPHFAMGLDVLCDMLRHSKFESGDIEKERTVIIEEINMSYDSPSQRVGLLIDELTWAGHPLGRDIAGTKATVSDIKRRDLLDYVCRHYQPTSTVIAIAGNINHDEVVVALQQQLGDWTGSGQRQVFKPYKEVSAERLDVEYRDIEQTHLCLALPGLSIFHPHRFTLNIMNVILGEGMSCRLFTRVRDQLGLAYSIHSFTEYLADTGALTVYAGVDTSKLNLALESILAEIMRLREEDITEEELTKAKELAKGHMLLRLEDSRNVAGWLGSQEIITEKVLTINKVVAILDAITARDIKSLAEELLKPEKLRLAVVGPVKKTAQLKRLIAE
jgi:predicted Zn-dependent peptidase